MFVGEVREAMPEAGYSWKLSGGSQLSSGLTNFAKKRHVRRAAPRKNVGTIPNKIRSVEVLGP